jgi:signal transduction histidine kinase
VRLRTRIAVTTLLVAGPVLVVMVWLKTRFLEQAASDVVVHSVRDHMKRGGRDVCEHAPATWQVMPAFPPPPSRRRFESGDERIAFPLHVQIGEGVHVRGVGAFAYDAQFVASNPAAPAVDDELRERIARESTAIRRLAGRPMMMEVLVRMPWRDGPCAMILVRSPDFRSDESLFELLPMRIWALVILIVLVAVVFGVGPAVRRIRQLTRDVRVAASAGYQQPIVVRGADEIGDLASAFNDAGREIRARMDAQEQRERTLRDFLDNTTHDVMTPLTVLQGHLAALAERGTPEQLARVSSAMDETHYMASLVHNLQLAAKLEAGAPDVRFEPFDLNALVGRVVARHQPIARNHDITLEHATPEAPSVANGDITFVEQAVSNLVLNAVQHVERGGHVAVRLDLVEPARFVIKIVDDGPGMPAADLDRVLQRGLRGNRARTRAPNGRGLGLDIVQRVVRHHAWTLTLATTEPHGLSVAITGPLARA